MSQQSEKAMTIDYKILGQPTRDNAAYVTVDSGQSVTRFLMDCGSGCTDLIKTSDLMSLDAFFVSHFHMDHICGFDSLFRFNFSRNSEHPFRIIGPHDTCRAVHHRLQGFTWNLVEDSDGVVVVEECGDSKIRQQLFLTRERFTKPLRDVVLDCEGRAVFENADCNVSMIELDHGCISAGYLVREKDSVNVDTRRLAELGVKPGAWIKQLKDSEAIDFTMEVDGRSYEMHQLREELLVRTSGESLAYLTDFRARGSKRDELVEFISEVDVLICENSYTTEDAELAERNFHMTTAEVASLARDANVGRLVLFHLSDRYSEDVFARLLEEARGIFAQTYWPEGWFERATKKEPPLL